MDEQQHGRVKATVDTYNQIAQIYQDKFMDMELYDATYDRFCSRVSKQGASIFEVGCGPGNITRYLLSNRPDFIIEATDLAPNMLALAEKNVPGATFYLMDCRDIGTLPGCYDGIVCGFAMPYLSKEACEQFIRDSALKLNSGGILYCSVIEDAYENSRMQVSSNGEFSMYIYCHEAKYLRSALAENGFTATEELRISYPGNATHLVLISEKQ
jgi:cyclopropane fatty-acyl-phospholipid synthase-like methyltransferase